MPELNSSDSDFVQADAQAVANAIEGLVTEDQLTSTSEFDPAEYDLNTIVNHLGRLSVRDVDHTDGSAQEATFTVYAPGVDVGSVWGVNDDDYVWRGVIRQGHGVSVVNDGDVVGYSNNTFQVFRSTGTPGYRHLDPPDQFQGTADTEEIARDRATAVGDVFIVGNNLLVVNSFTAGVEEDNRPFWRDLIADAVIFVNGTTLPTPEDVALTDRRKIHVTLNNGVIHSIAHLRETDERIGQWTIGQSGTTLGYRRGQYGRVNPGLNIERLYNVLDTSHTGSAVWLYVDSTGTIPRQANVTLYYRERDTTGTWRREQMSGGGDGSYVTGDHSISDVPRVERGKTYDVAIRTANLTSANVADLPSTPTDYIAFKPDGLEWVTLLDADAVDINRVHLDTIFDISDRQTRHYPVSLDWDNTNLRMDVQLQDGFTVEEGDLIVLGPIPSGMTSTDDSGWTLSVNGGSYHDVTGQDQLPIAPNRFQAGRYYQALVLDLEYVILDTFNLDDYAAVPTGGDDGQVLAKASDDDFDVEWVDGGGGEVEEEVLYEDTTDRTFTVTVWNTLTMSRGLSAADDGKDLVILLKSYVTNAADLTGTEVDTDIWESHVIPASEFRLLDNQTDAGTNGTHEPHFQWSVARGKNENTDWTDSEQSTVRLGKGSDTSWRIGSPDISYWRRVKIKLVNRVAGEAGSSSGLTNLFDGDRTLTTSFALIPAAGVEVPADKYLHVFFRAEGGNREGAVGGLSFPSNLIRELTRDTSDSSSADNAQQFTIPLAANRYVAFSTDDQNRLLIAAQDNAAGGSYYVKIDYSDDLIGGGGSSGDAQEAEDTGVTTIGGIHVRWRLQQWSDTEPASKHDFPNRTNGSFSDLGDWIREDQNPMTLGIDTSLATVDRNG